MNSDEPLGTVEYELTDDFAERAARALFDLQIRQVKEDIVRKGVPHAAAPLIASILILALAQAGALIWAWESTFARVLFFAGFGVHLLLLYKWALYFWPRFADWYIRRAARRMVRGLAPRTIRWTFFENRLETKSAVTHRSLAWRELMKVDIFPEFWCLHWKTRLLLIIPAAALPSEVQTLIRRRADEAGAPVRE